MKKRIGDRRDGKKIKNLNGMHYILTDLKPNRCDSDVYINQKIDVTNLIKYIERKKKENPENKITYFHAFSMAISKLFYNYPYLNRFICNRTYYERNEVIIAFVAKIAFEDNSDEVMINIKINEKDNIFDLSEKIQTRIDKIRKLKLNKKENTNNIVDKVGKLPKLIRVPLVGFLKCLDKHGWLPSFIIEDNLYYSSIILSSLGNLEIGSIYHNLTNFGTSSMLATIGKIHKEVIVDKNGKEKVVDICDFGINCDERIADGYYFAKAIKTFEYIIKNPELLEDQANNKIDIKD